MCNEYRYRDSWETHETRNGVLCDESGNGMVEGKMDIVVGLHYYCYVSQSWFAVAIRMPLEIRGGCNRAG